MDGVLAETVCENNDARAREVRFVFDLQCRLAAAAAVGNCSGCDLAGFSDRIRQSVFKPRREEPTVEEGVRSAKRCC